MPDELVRGKHIDRVIQQAPTIGRRVPVLGSSLGRTVLRLINSSAAGNSDTNRLSTKRKKSLPQTAFTKIMNRFIVDSPVNDYDSQATGLDVKTQST